MCHIVTRLCHISTTCQPWHVVCYCKTDFGKAPMKDNQKTNKNKYNYGKDYWN